MAAQKEMACAEDSGHSTIQISLETETLQPVTKQHADESRRDCRGVPLPVVGTERRNQNSLLQCPSPATEETVLQYRNILSLMTLSCIMLPGFSHSSLVIAFTVILCKFGG